MTDMAPNASGDKEMDQYHIYELVTEALRLAKIVSKNGATFLCKVGQQYNSRNLKGLKHREKSLSCEMIKLSRNAINVIEEKAW